MERLSAKALKGVGVQVGRAVRCLGGVDSTNTYLKARADQGAPHGLVVTAEVQFGGRGRQNRGFQSPEGKGLYLSVLLRPEATIAQAGELTAWVAVAAARAVEEACGLAPDIKWVNDLQIQGRKLCGVLCEMNIVEGELDYVVAGIGINVSQTPEDFSKEVAPLATSLAQWTQIPPSRTGLARALIGELDRMCAAFPGGREEYLAEYRARCVTPGQEVWILTPGGTRRGRAVGIDDQFRLEVDFGRGRVEALSSGEVSTRPVDKPGVGTYNDGD